MDITTSIANASTSMASGALMDKVGIALMSKALDQSETAGTQMVQMLEQSVNPMVGQNIDIRL